jgi:hypothetical protein
MNDQAAESPTRDGPDNTGLLQAMDALPIVQTYCVEEAVPKGNKFERHDGLAQGNSLGKNSFGVCAGWGGRESFLKGYENPGYAREVEDKPVSAYSWRSALSGSILTDLRAGR